LCDHFLYVLNIDRFLMIYCW